MIKEEIKKIIEKVIKGEVLNFSVETSSHADYSSNVALILAKKENKNPRETAELIKTEIEKQKNKLFSKIEVVNGFINFYLSEKYLKEQVQKVLKGKEKFGSSNIGKKQKINVEFISANPTGPLTLGNGRGGFGGDVLAKVLEKAGYKVSREYYINDIGAQITKLGHSVIGDEEAVYSGKYIEDLRKEIVGLPKSYNFKAEEIGEKAGKIILEKMIKPSVKRMGIKFDTWFSETTLYKNGVVDKTIAELTKKGFAYESEGALWFKSSELGDDKDRVLIREDGVKTYFASDIAYLRNKFERGFDKLIIFLGADHYGYVARLKAACQALGYNKENVDAIVLQLVKLFENGKEVRMSKRTGIYVTIDELIDEVGLDVARFFFLQRSLNTHFNFDMDLAKEKSDKNPVFKVQYAYARINSIFAKSKIKAKTNNLDLLKEQSELELIKQLIRFPEIIGDSANDYQLQRLPNYAIELADSFHKFYEKCRVVTEDKKLTEARLSLILATKIVLENALKLMGISTPKELKRNEAK
ncbi:MAG: arginine--tRNA ligase [Candidatus Staskawiczbacteria bacterium]|nr:arginine--tRNA ligase [Candidatus Staskawiczbacteria bacterium]